MFVKEFLIDITTFSTNLRSPRFSGGIVAVLLCLMIFSSASVAEVVNRYRFSTLGTDDGLLSLETIGVYQQKNGYIWIATDSGISRFDGVNFLHYQYKPDKERHISNNFVTDFLEDSKQRIWITTEEGLNRIESEGQITYFSSDPTKADSLPSNWTLSVLETHDQQILVGTGSGLVSYEEETQSFKPVVLDSDASAENIAIFDMIQDKHKQVWLATDSGLMRFQDNRLIPYHPSDPIHQELIMQETTAMFVDKTGLLWLGTDDSGLYSIDPVSNELHRYQASSSDSSGLKSNRIEAIAADKTGKIWVAHTYQGISIFDTQSKQFTHLAHDHFNVNALPSSYIHDVFVDQSGLVWISTKEGIAQYSPSQAGSAVIRNTPAGTGLTDATVWGIAAHKNTLWAAHAQGVDEIDMVKQTVTNLFDSVENKLSKEVWDVARATDGKIWMAQTNGISIYDPISKQLTQFVHNSAQPDSVSRGEIYRVWPQSPTQAWLASREGGLSLFDIQAGTLKRYLNGSEHPYMLDGHFPNDLLVARNGDVIVASTSGVYRINPQTDHEEHYILGKKNEIVRVNTVTEDLQGHLWVGTQGAGLARMHFNHHGQWLDTEYFGPSHGVKEQNIKSVQVTKDANIWLTTAHTVLQFNTSLQVFERFSNVVGQNSWQFLEGSAVTTGDQIYFGSNRGILKLDINQDYKNSFVAPVRITQVSIPSAPDMNVMPTLDKKYVFNYRQNTIKFSFAMLDYTAPAYNHYRYMLKGFDDQWRMDYGKNDVFYTNLDAGQYEFIVEGMNSDGVWSDQPARFQFSIQKAWWFYALIGFAVATILLVLSAALTRQKQINKLNRLANYDLLTDLPNRHRFTQALRAEISASAADNKKTFALLYLDLDNFKDVNDLYGHSTGDQLIIQAAKRIEHSVGEQNLVARFGGDEFGVIVTNYGRALLLNEIIRDIQKSLRRGYQVDGKWVRGSASIGVACYPDDGDNAELLLKNADTAMYAAKHAGRNQIYQFNQELADRRTTRLDMEGRLRKALENNALTMYFQPKVLCENQRVQGAEALCRWNDKALGAVSPSQFIPLAEESDLILSIGEWTLKTACAVASEWYHAGILTGPISVNVSSAQIYRTDLPQMVSSILNRTGLPGNYLELEITESMLMEDTDYALHILQQIRQMNVLIALDDFGTGFSSLNYLTRLPIDVLKVDKSFIDQIQFDKRSLNVFKTITTLASSLEMKVVAEGVETKEQYETVRGLACDMIQGYVFSRPLKARDFRKVLVQGRLETVS